MFIFLVLGIFFFCWLLEDAFFLFFLLVLSYREREKCTTSANTEIVHFLKNLFTKKRQNMNVCVEVDGHIKVRPVIFFERFIFCSIVLKC